MGRSVNLPDTMPEMTLIDFENGRGELSRWILAYGGIKYTNDCIKKEDWPTRKPGELLYLPEPREPYNSDSYRHLKYPETTGHFITRLSGFLC